MDECYRKVSSGGTNVKHMNTGNLQGADKHKEERTLHYVCMPLQVPR